MSSPGESGKGTWGLVNPTPIGQVSNTSTSTNTDPPCSLTYNFEINKDIMLCSVFKECVDDLTKFTCHWGGFPNRSVYPEVHGVWSRPSMSLYDFWTYCGGTWLLGGGGKDYYSVPALPFVSPTTCDKELQIPSPFYFPFLNVTLEILKVVFPKFWLMPLSACIKTTQ